MENNSFWGASLRNAFLALVAVLSAAGSTWAQDARIAASVLPQSRSVQSGETATAFATLINASDVEAQNCRIGLSSPVPVTLSYQTTDPATNAATGAADTPVNISARGAQSFVFSLATQREFNTTEVSLRFECDNAAPAIVRDRVNLFRLSASDPASPDIIAQAATIQNDGFVHLPDETRVGVFAVATSNVGLGGQITVRAESGDANPPVTYEICRTDPLTGGCATPRAETQTLFMGAFETFTFGVFVRPNGFVPRRAALYRAIIVFDDANGVERGSTSVALQTDNGTAPSPATAVLGFPSGQSFQIASVDDRVDVEVSIDAQNFVLGSDGRAALFINDQLFSRYESAQTVSLNLPGGQHDIALRLVEMDNDLVFPDARSEAQITIATGGVPRLELPSGFSTAQPFQLVDFIAHNIFPQGETYSGTLNGQAVDIVATSLGRMALLIPDLDGYSGNAVLNLDIDGTEYALTIPVAASTPIADPASELSTVISDLVADLTAQRDAATISGLTDYASAMQRVINDVNDAESALAGLPSAEQAVALRLLRNLVGPSASPLLDVPQILSANGVSTCRQRLSAISFQTLKGNLAGLAFAGIGAKILATAGVSSVGVVAGSITLLAGAALLYSFKSEVVEAISDCFSQILSVRVDERDYSPPADLLGNRRYSYAQTDERPVFIDTVYEDINLTVRREAIPEARLFINEIIDLLESASSFIPDVVLIPTIEKLIEVRDEQTVYIPSAEEISVAVTAGEVDFVGILPSSPPGVFQLAFTADTSTDFTFSITVIDQAISVPAFLEASPPVLVTGSQVFRVPEGGIVLPLNASGNIESVNIIRGNLPEYFTYSVQTTPTLALHITPADGFLGAEAFQIEFLGRGGTREVLPATAIATGEFFFPIEHADRGLFPSSLGRRKHAECYMVSRVSADCEVWLPTVGPPAMAGMPSEMNGIPQTIDLSGLPTGMFGGFTNPEQDRFAISPPVNGSGVPQPFSGTLNAVITQGQETRTIPIDVILATVPDGSPCNFCERDISYAFGTVMDRPYRLGGLRRAEADARIIGGPTNGTLTEDVMGFVSYEPNEGFTGSDQIIMRTVRDVSGISVTYNETVDILVLPPMLSDAVGSDITMPSDVSCVDIYDGPAPSGITRIRSGPTVNLEYGSYNANTGEFCVDRSITPFFTDVSVLGAFDYGSNRNQAEVLHERRVVIEQ